MGTAYALFALGTALPIAARAACQVETLELPVKMVGSRATASVGINGTSVPLTVDSGAFFSTLTDAAAAQLKLPLRFDFKLRVGGVTGRVDTQVTTVDTLQLFKGEMHRVDFIVGGSEPGADTMGFIGRNILSLTDTEYDLAHGAIRFLFPNDDCAKSNMAYWAGSTPVTELELKTDDRSRVPAVRVQAELNGRTLVAMFDSGATTSIVSARAARRAGVAEADWLVIGSMSGMGDKTAKLWMAPFDEFKIGGEAIRHNRLAVSDFDVRETDMLLGIDFFLSHRIYVSKQQKKVFFTYNGGPVFALDRTGPANAPTDAPAAAAAGDADASAALATTADELMRRGSASASRADYESALSDLNRACELEPTSGACFAQRGVVQQSLKRAAKALEDFDHALTLDPSQDDARLRRASLRFAAKDRDGAKADLDTLDRTVAPQAQARLAMSRLYAELEQPAQALAQLNQWLPAHPHEPLRENALNARCLTRLRLGIELDQALDDCGGAVDGDPKNPVYLTSRGWLYVRTGKYRNALSDFDRSIEIRAANAPALYGRGVAKTRLGDVAQGDADLAAARKLQPDIELRMARAGLVPEPTQKP